DTRRHFGLAVASNSEDSRPHSLEFTLRQPGQPRFRGRPLLGNSSGPFFAGLLPCSGRPQTLLSQPPSTLSTTTYPIHREITPTQTRKPSSGQRTQQQSLVPKPVSAPAPPLNCSGERAQTAWHPRVLVAVD